MKKSLMQTFAGLPLVRQMGRVIAHLYHINRNLEFVRTALGSRRIVSRP